MLAASIVRDCFLLAPSSPLLRAERQSNLRCHSLGATSMCILVWWLGRLGLGELQLTQIARD